MIKLELMNEFVDLTKFLINGNYEDHVSFGSKEYAPEESVVKIAERIVGSEFPPSYRWFIGNYASGEVFGYELFSIYGPDPSVAGSGDIVFHTLYDRENGFLEDNEVALLRTDFGEDFIWKTDEVDEDGEYPVYIKRGEHREYYAPNYIAFLIKYIKSCLEEE